MIYLDSSSLLKLLWTEPESAAVRQAVAREDTVVISILAELEAENRLKAAWLAGRYREGQWRRYRRALRTFGEMAPFRSRTLPGSVFQSALRQHDRAGRIHCRTPDRLHLAAMEELQLSRLLTHDTTQAAAARAQGFEVLIPGGEG